MAKGKVTEEKTKPDRLRPLSTGGTGVNRVIKAFLKVDPEKVNKRLKKDGIKKKSK